MSNEMIIPSKRFTIQITFIKQVNDQDGYIMEGVADTQLDEVMMSLRALGAIFPDRTVALPSNFASISIREMVDDPAPVEVTEDV